MDSTLYKSNMYLITDNNTLFIERELDSFTWSQGIKRVEFVRKIKFKNHENLVFIEAKSSSPHPNNKSKFKEFINNVANKVIQSVWTIMALHLRHNTQLPLLKSTDIKILPFIYILILKNHPDDALIDIKNSLEDTLRQAIQYQNWKSNPSVFVFNEKMAIKYGLVVNNILDDTL